LRVADCGQRFALPDNLARASNNKQMKWKWEKKNGIPPEPWKSVATTLAMRSRKMRSSRSYFS
jgi:hypothetical protein